MHDHDKLTRLAELQEDRAATEKRLEAIDDEIERLIGDGFVMGGVKVVPLRRKKRAATLEHEDDEGVGPLTGVTDHERAQAVSFDPNTDELAAPMQPVAPSDPRKLNAAVHQCYVETVDPMTPDECAKLMGWQPSKVRNAVYWLYKQKKLTRVDRGMYKAA